MPIPMGVGKEKWPIGRAKVVSVYPLFLPVKLLIRSQKARSPKGTMKRIRIAIKAVKFDT